MYKQILLTSQEEVTDSYAIYWVGNECTVTHGIGDKYTVGIVDGNGKLYDGATYVALPNELRITFDHALGVAETYTINIADFKGDAGSPDQATGKEYYSGHMEDVLHFCRSLDISGDRLSNVPRTTVEHFQQLVDDAIDGYLVEYYFVPLQKYNQVQNDGTVKLVFPGKIRFLAVQWVAGLLLESQFQNSEPNMNEQGMKFVEEAKKEMQQMVDFSTRIPGQRRKHPCPTMPPNLAPSKTNEFQL